MIRLIEQGGNGLIVCGFQRVAAVENKSIKFSGYFGVEYTSYLSDTKTTSPWSKNPIGFYQFDLGFQLINGAWVFENDYVSLTLVDERRHEVQMIGRVEKPDPSSGTGWTVKIKKMIDLGDVDSKIKTKEDPKTFYFYFDRVMPLLSYLGWKVVGNVYDSPFFLNKKATDEEE